MVPTALAVVVHRVTPEIALFLAVALAIVAALAALAIAHRQDALRAADQQRLVLDHVNQGLFAITYAGQLVGERSRATQALLGDLASDRLVDIVREHDSTVAAGFELGFAQLVDDVLPVEVAIAQLPQRLLARGRLLAFTYTRFVDSDDQSSPRLLVTLTDVTDERRHAEAHEVESESAAFFLQLAQDRHGVRRFVDDARGQIDLVVTTDAPGLVLEALHTLKGNAALMGLARWVTKCHDAETAIEEQGELSLQQRRELAWAWTETEARISPLLADHRIDLGDDEYEALVRIAESEVSWTAMRDLLHALRLEATALPLRRLADHCCSLAARLHRPLGALVVEDHGVRLDPDAWSPLWSVLTHVARNLVIHGMSEDTPTDIALRTIPGAEGVTIEIVDTGRGIQWEDLRARAHAANLPCATREDLVSALFSPSISTHGGVDETAGRGVGLAAVASTCRELGVSIEVPVQVRGTMFRFHVPTVASPSLPLLRAS